jgi:hypothetical protein
MDVRVRVLDLRPIDFNVKGVLRTKYARTQLKEIIHTMVEIPPLM